MSLDTVELIWNVTEKARDLMRLEEEKETLEFRLRAKEVELEKGQEEFDEWIEKAGEFGLDLGKEKWSHLKKNYKIAYNRSRP